MDTSGISIHRATGNSAAAQYLSSAKAASVASPVVAATDAGFGFGDLLDIVNPLQHIPGVSSIYRAITGDEIGGIANVIGSTLFGGPIGGGLALANEIVEGESGKNIGGHISSALLGEDTDPTKATLAANSYKDTDDRAANNANRQRSTTHSWIYGGTHLA